MGDAPLKEKFNNLFCWLPIDRRQLPSPSILGVMCGVLDLSVTFLIGK